MTVSRKHWTIIRISIAVMVSGILLISLVRSGEYQTNHNLPNPYWGIFNPTYTYAVTVGPPAKNLVDTRPETIVAQYIKDYIAVAGTYPCTNDFADYTAQIDDDHTSIDPVLDNKPCLIKRPVQQVEMQSVKVALSNWIMFAYVTFKVTYADGHLWTFTIHLIPASRKGYYRADLHLSCWYYIDELDLYAAFFKQGRALPTTTGLYYTLTQPYRQVCNP